MKIRSFRPKVNKSQDGNVILEGAQRPMRPKASPPSVIESELMQNKDPIAKTESSFQDDRKTVSNPKPHDVLKLIPLGGVGDVTKNMYVYEYKDDILIVDCGVSFPTEEQLGVDLVIPDITYLRDKKHKVKGIVITHGHDDHIGGLPYIWPELDVPIYSQKLTCGFIKNKFTEHNLPKDKIKELDINSSIQLGVFDVSFYQVSHSIPDSTGIVIRTPMGIIVHQADFKMDWTPVNGQITDLGRVASVAKEGIVLMNIDCLRVEKQGYNLSERTIEGTFAKVEKDTKGMVLITMTSSNITRIQQAINVAVNSGRKLALSGRSLENNFQTARDLGYLDVPAGLVVGQDQVKRFPPEKVMVLIAGAFGQPGSSLSRAANGDHKFIKIGKSDAVVFSADPIPSTESQQYSLIDTLTELGCEVYYSSIMSDLHVSGHAASEELKTMISVAKPKYLLPIGGNYRHMKQFARMASTMGYEDKQVILPVDGDVLEIGRGGVIINGHEEVFNVYVDGYGIGDVGTVVLRDRQVLAEDGIVLVVVSVNRRTGQVIGEPEIVSRGFVYEKTAEDLLEAAKGVVKSCLSDHEQGIHDWRYMKHHIEENLQKFFYEETKRNPMIVTAVADL